jgi:hypothetical protein
MIRAVSAHCEVLTHAPQQTTYMVANLLHARSRIADSTAPLR